MSNYALQSQANQLNRELNQQQQINNELRQEISTVTNGVARADKQLIDYNNHIQNTLQNSNDMMVSSTDRVIAAYELQGEIEKLYARFKNMELANKKIRACNNKRYYDFGNYRTVRKIVQGMMDNFDVKMVSDKTITKSIEVQHLQAPEYWLTCVLISIMAWKNDDKELSDRAMERAIRLDKKNTCIFYMIFNLRMRRDGIALKWFDFYQECDLKGGDQRTFLMLFSLVSKTITAQIDDDTSNQINKYINKVLLENAKAEGFSEDDVISLICTYFKRLQQSEAVNYSVLKKYCAEFGYLSELMLNAKTNINILEFILATLNVPPEQKNEFLKGYIDELISAPNQLEKEVYDETNYNELVIDFKGDVEAAKEKFDYNQKKIADNLNLISEMINWIYIKDSKDVNGQIRQNVFTLTKDLQEKAVTRYVEDYRRKIKNNYQIQINEYATIANFENEAKEKDKVTEYFTEKKNGFMVVIKDWKAYVGFGVGTVALVGAFFAGYLLTLTLISAGYSAGVLLTNKSKRKQLEYECQDSIRNTTEILTRIFIDYKEYQKEFAEYDGMFERIKNEFSKI